MKNSFIKTYNKGQIKSSQLFNNFRNHKLGMQQFKLDDMPLFATPFVATGTLGTISTVTCKKIATQGAVLQVDTADNLVFESETAMTPASSYITKRTLGSYEQWYSNAVAFSTSLADGLYIIEISDGLLSYETEIVYLSSELNPLTCSNFTAGTSIATQEFDITLDVTNPSTSGRVANITFTINGVDYITANTISASSTDTITVTLTAPSASGVYAVTWAGDCSGSQNVTVEAAVIMTTDGSVTFNLYNLNSSAPTIDWGDGSATETFTTNTVITHNYAATGSYQVVVYNNLTAVTEFRAYNSEISQITGLDNLTNCTNFKIYGNNVLTDPAFISDLNTSATYFDLQGNGTTGNVPALEALVNATTLILRDNDFSGAYDFTAITGLASLNLYNNDNMTSLNCSGLTSLTACYLQLSTSSTGMLNLATVNFSGCTALTRTYIPTDEFILARNKHTSINITNCTSLAFNTIKVLNIDTVGTLSTIIGIDTCNYEHIRIINNDISAAEMDNLLIDCDTSGVSTGVRLFTATGNNGRTSASDTAVTNLAGKGWTVTV